MNLTRHTKLLNHGSIAPILLIIAIFWLYPVINPADPRYSAYYRFGVCVFIFFALLLWKINKSISLFVILCGISSMFPFSTKATKDALLAVSFGAAWFYLVATYGIKENIINAIAVIGILNCIMILSQWSGHDPIFKPARINNPYPIVGFLSNKNEVSALLAFCLPAYFRDKWKKFIPLIVLGLFAAKSTGGVISAFVCVVAYFFLRYGVENAIVKNKWTILAMASGLLAFLIWRDNLIVHNSLTESANRRLFIWSKALRLIKLHPMLGSGIGHWKVVWKHIPTPDGWWKYAHNEYVQSVFEMGVGALALMVSYFVGFFKSYDKEKAIPMAAIICIAVNSLVNFPLHIAQTAIVAITWMGVLEINNVTDCATLQRTSSHECCRLHSNGRKPDKLHNKEGCK